MGSCNQALWRAWGVTAGRYSEIKCTVAHPLHSDKVVFVFADVPHLFKNIKSMFISNKVIRIPNDIKEKQKLPTNEVLASHIYEIIAHEKEHSFKLAPKLSERDLFPSHFGKMEVCTSTSVVNHTVSSALKFLAEELDKPAYLTTAWFLDQVERWFHLMTSRHPSCALSKFNLNVYRDSIAFLKDFRDLFCNMEVGQKKIWKPSQTGVLISTQAMLELQANLLEDRQYKFLLTSRFPQDCLENLFSVLKSKQCVPNAVQVKNNLKLICVSQYLRNAPRSSYEEDDREFLSGFLDTLHEVKPKSEEVEISAGMSHPMASLNSSELNSLYNVSGYIVQSIQKTSKTCSTCISAVGSKTPMYETFTRFTNFQCFREDTLFFCSEETFQFFVEMENIFVMFLPSVSVQDVNLKQFYFKEMSKLELNIPDCHELKTKIISRYIVYRLKINSKICKPATNTYASKSIAGHSL